MPGQHIPRAVPWRRSIRLELVGPLGETPQEVLESARTFSGAREAAARIDHRQAVVEVLAEGPISNFPLEVLVGRSHQPDVDVASRLVADGSNLAGLEEAQELDLHGERHLRDFVQEDRSSCANSKSPSCWRSHR